MYSNKKDFTFMRNKEKIAELNRTKEENKPYGILRNAINQAGISEQTQGDEQDDRDLGEGGNASLEVGSEDGEVRLPTSHGVVHKQNRKPKKGGRIMPRPPKEGLEFWCLDVDAFDDEKLIRLVMKAGHEAVAIWSYITSAIYRVGMCYRWGEAEAEALAYKRNIDLEKLNKAVQAMLEVKLFDKPVFESTGYLTSKGIQRRFRAAATRRVPKELPEGVDLLCPKNRIEKEEKENKKEKENRQVAENPVSATISPIIAAETPVKETETQKRDKKPHGWREKTQEYGMYGRVYLTLDEYEELTQEFGEQNLKAKITSLDANIENGLKKYLQYKNHCATLRNWLTSDKANGKLITPKKSNFQKNVEELKKLEEESNGR